MYYGTNSGPPVGVAAQLSTAPSRRSLTPAYVTSIVNVNTGKHNTENLSLIYLRGSGALFQNVLPKYKQKKKITYKFNHFYDRSISSDKLVWHSYGTFLLLFLGIFFLLASTAVRKH